MDRRYFLHAGATLAGAFAARSAFPAALAAAVATDETYPLLRDAALAPSSHNTQPWQVRLHDARRWTLSPATGRALPVVDPQGRELWESLGAFIVALDVSAAARGLHVESAFAAEPAPRVDITFSASAADSTGLAALRRRRTLRRELGPVGNAGALVAACAGRSSSAHFFAAGTPGAQTLAGATLEANRLQAADDAVWVELARWIRWRESEARADPTGITPEMMELPWLARRWVEATYSQADVLAPAFRERSTALVEQQAREGAGWIVFVTDDEGPRDWLRAGADLMRLWLRGVPLALAVHPMSQSLEIPAARAALENALGIGRVHLLVRVGSRAYPQGRVSPRLAPAEISIDA
jgi:hypothetical protein